MEVINSTLHQTFELYVEMKLDKFFDLPKEVDYILESPSFSFANNKWILQMYPNLPSISAYLKMQNLEGECSVYFQLGVKKTDGSDFSAAIDNCTFKKGKELCGWSNYISRSTLETYKDIAVPNGTLTIFCKVRSLNSIAVIPRTTSSIDTGGLSDNLENLYTSQRFTDVKLIVKGRGFSAHKNILSCRVTAFGLMKENIPDEIEITDCDPDSFGEFIFYLYTGKLVDLSSKIAMSLYETADKYNLQDLKEECTRSITEHNLSIDSFSDILSFANLHSHSALLEASTDFFTTNAKSILSSEKWEKFLENHPLQGNKLFLSYVEKKN